MVRATYYLLVDWDNNGFNDVSNEDITTDAVMIECKRGRDYASQLIGKATAGQLSARLRNDTGKYSRFNAASPLFGSILPGRRVALIASDGVSYSTLAGDLDGSTDAFEIGPKDLDGLGEANSLGVVGGSGHGDEAFDIVMLLRTGASLPSSGNTMRLWSKEGDTALGSNLDHSLYIDNTAGTIRFKFSVRDLANSATTTVTATTFGAPSTNTFYMVHCKHDPAGNVIGIAVNNGAFDTQAMSGGYRAYTGTQNVIEFGAAATLPRSAFFNGRIQFAALWCHSTTLLTSAQRTWLYNSGLGRDYSELGIPGNDGTGLLNNLMMWLYFGTQLVDPVLGAASAQRDIPDLHGDSNHGCGGGYSIGTPSTAAGAGNLPRYITLWSGFLEDIQPIVSPGPEVWAELKAFGAMTQLSEGAESESLALSTRTTDELIKKALEAAYGGTFDVYSNPDIDVEMGKTTVSTWFVNQRDVLNVVRELEETELGFFYEKASRISSAVSTKTPRQFRFENRHHRLTALASTVSQATFSDDPADSLHYVEIEQGDALREIFNEVKATVQPYVTGGLEVLWTLTGETPTLAPGQARTFIASYPTALEGGDLGAYVDAWTTPVVGTDITQTGVANGDIAVSASKTATRMFITITNNHASATASLTLVQARGTPVTKSNPTTVHASDATSQASYDKREYVLPAPWLASTNEAQDYCDYVVSRYKDPTPVLSIGVVANRDAAHMQQCLERAISDRVTIEADGNAQLGILDDFFIEAIEHQITDGGLLHKTNFQLSAVSADSGYWILGTSELGVDTRLGY